LFSPITLTEQMRAFARAIRAARCAEASTNDGARCDDVSAALIHIALSKLPPSPAQDRLLAIPTSLTIPRGDVDLLIAAGETAVTGSVPLRGFLADHPPRLGLAER
jgi:hypothetical protein